MGWVNIDSFVKLYVSIIGNFWNFNEESVRLIKGNKNVFSEWFVWVYVFGKYF